MSELRNAKTLLREVESLKRRSRKLRDEGNLRGAIDEVNKAIQLLEPEIARRRGEVDLSQQSTPALQDLRGLAVELADLYGSRGGIYRRDQHYPEALESYAKGRALEQSEDYRVDNTYNQVQWILLQILENPKVIDPPASPILKEIDRTMETLAKQLLTTRRDDPWAQSDLGLLKLLRRDEAGANQAWDEVDALKPVPAVYRSGLLVLRDLAAKLPGVAAIQKAVDRFERRAN
jgi:tetratricopeptide (TPR) repeat protein